MTSGGASTARTGGAASSGGGVAFVGDGSNGSSSTALAESAGGSVASVSMSHGTTPSSAMVGGGLAIEAKASMLGSSEAITAARARPTGTRRSARPLEELGAVNRGGGQGHGRGGQSEFGLCRPTRGLHGNMYSDCRTVDTHELPMDANARPAAYATPRTSRTS